jgi:hypothetical protein
MHFIIDHDWQMMITTMDVALILEIMLHESNYLGKEAHMIVSLLQLDTMKLDTKYILHSW